MPLSIRARVPCVALLSPLLALSVFGWRPAQVIDPALPLKVDSLGRLKMDHIRAKANASSGEAPTVPPPRKTTSPPRPQHGTVKKSLPEDFVTMLEDVTVGKEASSCITADGKGCKVGCRCSFLRVCLPKPHHGTTTTSQDSHELGVCSVDVSRAAAVFGLVFAVMLASFKKCIQKNSHRNKVATTLQKMLPIDPAQIQTVLDCVAGAEESAKRRRELEARLRKATPMSVQQSQVLLGHFFNFACEDDDGSKNKRKKLRARLASQREYNLPSMEMEMENLPPSPPRRTEWGRKA